VAEREEHHHLVQVVVVAVVAGTLVVPATAVKLLLLGKRRYQTMIFNMRLSEVMVVCLNLLLALVA
jgi:hypothetical protein